MSSSYSSGKTTVNGTVTTNVSNLGYPTGNASQTIIAGTATITTNATTTLRTVTAGKTFYLTGLFVSGNGAGTDIAITNFRNDGTSFYKGAHGIVGSSALQMTPSTPITSIAATKVLDVITTGIVGGINVSYTGFEQ